MPTLFETIQQNLSQPKQVQSTGDSTAAVQNLSRASTGKLSQPGASSAPQMSNLASQISENQAQQQLNTVAQQGQIQATELKQQNTAQTQQQDNAQLDLDDASVAQQEDYNTQAANMIQDFTNKGKQLDLRKDAAKVETLGARLRLADDQYVTRLKTEGSRSRLDNQINFEEAMTKAVFEDEMDLFNNDLEFRSLMKATGRDFERDLASLDINQAIALASADKEAANTRMLWSGVGSLVSAGAQIYAKTPNSAEEESTPAPAPKPAPATASYWSSTGTANKLGQT